MAILHHYPLAASSRLIRLQCGEYKLSLDLVTQLPWLRDEKLLALNPAGELPVFEDETHGVICGARVISEWIEETVDNNFLMPKKAGERAEVRRLIDWFEGKFTLEVTRPLLRERVIKRFQSGQPASSQILRAALANAQIHLGYVDWLAGQYSWLAGPDISLADLSAAAHISVLDYFGDVDWQRYPEAKLWYMKLKSRSCFRPLLSDVLVGMPPASHYSNLDF